MMSNIGEIVGTDVATLLSMSRHSCRCRDIVVDVATLRRSFLHSSRNFFTSFPHFIFAILVHACEYKSYHY